jgi:hypothetical protein
MALSRQELSDRAMRWIRAALSLLIGAALLLLGAAMFDHQNEMDLTSVAAMAVGFFCVLRGLVLFWTH